MPPTAGRFFSPPCKPKALKPLGLLTFHEAQIQAFADTFRAIIDSQQDLAKLAGVHRTTVTVTPANARLQGFLREAWRALSAAYRVTQDRDRAISSPGLARPRLSIAQ